MARTVSLHEAKTHLSSLVEAASAGEEIVIAKNGKAKARLVPLPAVERPQRVFGLYKGQIGIADDFDAPWPEDIRRSLEGEEEQEFYDPPDAPPSGR